MLAAHKTPSILAASFERLTKFRSEPLSNVTWKQILRWSEKKRIENCSCLLVHRSERTFNGRSTSVIETSPSPSLSKNSTSSESFRSVAIPSLYLVGHRSISHFLPHKIEVDTGVLLSLNGSSRALDQLRDVIQRMSASSLSPLPLPFPAIRCPTTLEKYLAREAVP